MTTTSIKQLAKRILPPTLVASVQAYREATANRRTENVFETLDEQFPWCSPNVWQKIVSGYQGRARPTVFEYGTGSSTLHHVDNLIDLGGHYIAVEDDAAWFWHVVSAVLRRAHRLGVEVEAESRLVEYPKENGTMGLDMRLTLDREPSPCTVTLKLRPRNETGGDLDTHYVRTLEKADVVIVDGPPETRKACVREILGDTRIPLQALIVLHGAGRGRPGWLGLPQATGVLDLQPEVNEMLRLGGTLIDGTGRDRWQPDMGLRSHRSTARSFPLEACFLQRETPREEG